VHGKIGWKNKGKYVGNFPKVTGKFPPKLSTETSFGTLIHAINA
jgi:hypothetical protein